MIKRNDGSQWVDASHVRRWDGSQWVDAEFARRWDGSQWVDVWVAGPVPPDGYTLRQSILADIPILGAKPYDGAWGDTGISPTKTIGVSISYIPVGALAGNGCFAFGSFNDDPVESYFHVTDGVLGETTNGKWIGYANQLFQRDTVWGEVSNLSINFQNNSLIVDNGFEIDISAYKEIYNPVSQTIYFAQANNFYALTHHDFIGYILSLELSDGENVVFNGVPVRRDSDGAYGLWDYIGQKFCPSITNNAFKDGGDPAAVSSLMSIGVMPSDGQSNLNSMEAIGIVA